MLWIGRHGVHKTDRDDRIDKRRHLPDENWKLAKLTTAVATEVAAGSRAVVLPVLDVVDPEVGCVTEVARGGVRGHHVNRGDPKQREIESHLSLTRKERSRVLHDTVMVAVRSNRVWLGSTGIFNTEMNLQVVDPGGVLGINVKGDGDGLEIKEKFLSRGDIARDCWIDLLGGGQHAPRGVGRRDNSTVARCVGLIHGLAHDGPSPTLKLESVVDGWNISTTGSQVIKLRVLALPE